MENFRLSGGKVLYKCDLTYFTSCYEVEYYMKKKNLWQDRDFFFLIGYGGDISISHQTLDESATQVK